MCRKFRHEIRNSVAQKIYIIFRITNNKNKREKAKSSQKNQHNFHSQHRGDQRSSDAPIK